MNIANLFGRGFGESTTWSINRGICELPLNSSRRTCSSQTELEKQ